MGKTRIPALSSRPFGKHPHLRGENSRLAGGISLPWETSPPAWGKPHSNSGFVHCFGNIPTCVGKTRCCRSSRRLHEKHPHLRGENRKPRTSTVRLSETSPPAWGKHRLARPKRSQTGNIPTCVGKTYEAMHKVRASGKHPHLRGENLKSDLLRYPVMETSPPAWGKPSQGRRERQWPGNIPTCVGKTARFCLDCHSGYYILLKSKFLALSLRQGRAIFAYHPSLGIDLRLAEAQRDVPNDCGGRVIKGRLLPN